MKSRLSLKWLEVFVAVARTGALKAAARDLGLSVSTVSHHLRALENALGVKLIDHGARPMIITPEGAAYLRHVEAAMELLRKGEAALISGSPQKLRSLRLALIEDFESDIAPELTRLLAQALPDCDFSYLTRPSHDILSMLRAGDIEIGVATRPQFDLDALKEYPLLRDPYVLAVPKAAEFAPDAYLRGETGLQFLRYSDALIMGAQISAQLRRLRLSLASTFQFESNHALLGMVADGQGWAITTPTNYLRARRYHGDIALHPFPAKTFSRHISLFTREDYSGEVAQMIAQVWRQLIQVRTIVPAHEAMPWLEGDFGLAPAAAQDMSGLI